MKKNTLILLSILFTLTTAAQNYATNYAEGTQLTHATRRTSSISLTSPYFGEQRVKLNQANDILLYQDAMNGCFKVHAGEALTATFGFNADWMNGYVYVDRNNDGVFDTPLNTDGTPTDDSEVLTYSHYNAMNSTGASVTGGARSIVNPPSFILPNLEPGVYRIRYKIDWDCIDPAGNTASDNDILKNGGVIADTRLVVMPEQITISGDCGTLQTDGKKNVTLSVPNREGMMVSKIIIRHGFNIDGEAIVNGNRQWTESTLMPGALASGSLTIPASLLDGDVRVTLHWTTTIPESGEEYAFPYDTESHVGEALLQSVQNANALRQRTYTPSDNTLACQDFTSMISAPVLLGESVSLSLNGIGGETTVIVDLNQDGRFTPANELVFGENTESGQPFTFSLPTDITLGVYRARIQCSGYAIDLLLNVHADLAKLYVDSRLCRVIGRQTYTSRNATVDKSGGVPTQVATYKFLGLLAQSIESGYSGKTAHIRHGQNLGGPQSIHGVAQWTEYDATIADNGNISIPIDSVWGDIRVWVDFSAYEDATPIVFDDEFESESIDEDKWRTSQRQSAAWNRFISSDPLVAYVEDGALVCRAIANPDKTKDSADMLSGAKETRGKFSFTYGYVEVRALTHPHSGNFPAIWLMPENTTGGWPTCGEIDIWETINSENKAYQTVHSNWTYNLGNTGNPQSGHNQSCTQEATWHTYGLRHEPTKLTWYIDGTEVCSYNKSTDQEELNNGQWPFDKAFYVILNQSVGNGSWAASPDKSFTYETLFDWCRVYQTPEQYAQDGNSPVGVQSATENTSIRYTTGTYTLSGQKVSASSKLAPGVYIINGQKKVKK